MEKFFENRKHVESRPPPVVVEAEEVVQEAAPVLVAHLRPGRRLPDDAASAAAPRDGAMAPEEVEAQVSHVGGPVGDAGALC